MGVRTDQLDAFVLRVTVTQADVTVTLRPARSLKATNRRLLRSNPADLVLDNQDDRHLNPV